MNAGHGHNGMSRDDWLFAILQSGQVTRIAQHLALVIYHLSDPTTNIAKLSARDLEALTGWGRTTIRQHVDELDAFISVTWGQGRAKALFELQGVIAEAVRPLKAARDADRNGQSGGHNAMGTHLVVASQVATTPPAEPLYGQSGGHNAPSVVVSQVATNGCGGPDGHNNGRMTVVHAATTENGQPDGHNQSLVTTIVATSRTQNADGGDYRGGSLGEEVSKKVRGGEGGSARESIRVIEIDREPPPFIVHDDGSFSGTAFEHFTATEVASFRLAYEWIDVIPSLIEFDRYLTKKFAEDNTPFDSPLRMERLLALLRKKNDEAKERVLVMRMGLRDKAAVHESDSCWFTDEGRLMVANGFKAELVEIVGGDEARLRRVLDKAAGNVPIDLRGKSLLKNVRSAVVRHADWTSHDERKTAAVEARRKFGEPTMSGDRVETRAQRLERMALAMEKGGKS